MNDNDKTPEDTISEYESRLNDVLADVEEPAVTDERASLELAGLEINRRDLMRTGVVAGAGAATGFAGSSLMTQGGHAASDDHFVEPGETDTYYGFWSGGHSGEVRVLGMPSMREIRRIPVFQRDGAVGYGHDEKTKQVLEEGGDMSSRHGLEWGDCHH